MTSSSLQPLSSLLMKAVQCRRASFTFPIMDYLTRIGLTKQNQQQQPSLALLQKITAAHSFSIPFENLDCIMDRVISLDLHDLCNKLIYAQRGGYCLEQNSLLLAALQSLRFTNCRALAGRVLLDGGEEESLGRTHMTLLVPISQRRNDSCRPQVNDLYIVDVGFGAYYSLAPISLNLVNVPQDTPGGTFRVVKQTRYVDLNDVQNSKDSNITTNTLSWQKQQRDQMRQDQLQKKEFSGNYILNETNTLGWDEYILQVDLNSLKQPNHNVQQARKWLSMYSFDLQPQCAQDFNIYNYYIRTNSFFRYSLLALRARGTWNQHKVNKMYEENEKSNPRNDSSLIDSVCNEVVSLVDYTMKTHISSNTAELNSNAKKSVKTVCTTPEELYDAITTQFGICCSSDAFPQYAISREAFVQKVKAKLSDFGGTGYVQQSLS